MAYARLSFVLLLGLCWGVAFMSCQENQNVTQSNDELNEPDFPTPEYIIPCNRTDPKLDLCFQNTLNHLRPYLMKDLVSIGSSLSEGGVFFQKIKKGKPDLVLSFQHLYLGIPELDLPSIEPLLIPELKIENGQGPVRIHAFFSNLTAIGPGNYSITKIHVNIPSYRFDIYVTFPKIELQGFYDVSGNVLLFPIESHGAFWALFSDILAVARVQGIEEIKDGVRYLKIGKLLVDFKLGRVRFHVMDQQNGNNVIGQAMNQFLNQNAHEIIDELRPAASAAIAKHFKNFLGGAFDNLPMKVWIHDT